MADDCSHGLLVSLNIHPDIEWLPAIYGERKETSGHVEILAVGCEHEHSKGTVKASGKNRPDSF